MGVNQASVRGRVGFAHLTQGGLLKPSEVFTFTEPTFAAGFQTLTGMARPEYFAKHGMRGLFTYLAITRTPRSLDLDVVVEARLTARFGWYAPRAEGAPRYGGRDQVTILDESDHEVATYLSSWYWFRSGSSVDPLLHEPAPDVTVDQGEQLERAPSRPVVGEDAPAVSRFRWASRETDLNNHVFFRSYLERAENGLADAGVDTLGLHRWEVWFLRPAFQGEAMSAHLVAADDGFVVALRRSETGETCALIRAS